MAVVRTWLRGEEVIDWEVYIVKRKAYKRAVIKAKTKFDEKRYDYLEGLMRNPKKWWKAVKCSG